MSLAQSQECCRFLVHQDRLHEVLQVKFTYFRRDLDAMHDLWYSHDFNTFRNPRVRKLPVSALVMAEALAELTDWTIDTCRRHIRRAGFECKDLNDFGPADLYQPEAFAFLPFDHPEPTEGPFVELREDAQLGAAIIFFTVPRADAVRAMTRLVTDWRIETGRA